MSAVGLLTCRRTRSARKWSVLTTIAMVVYTAGGPGFMPAVNAQVAPVGAGFRLDAGDLRFIFHQIEISQAHSAAPLGPGLDPCAALFGPGPNQVNERRLPFGLRTVDGSCNHLTPGQTTWGASDQLFPRLTTPDFTPEGGAAYPPTGGNVTDPLPRIISNLIVDQTDENPAAVEVASAGLGALLTAEECPAGASGRCEQTFFFPNVAADVGLSAPFNVMFTFFGQFFDHGLDLVNKGGSGTVFVPLQADDPLVRLGPDGVAGTGDEQPVGSLMMLSRAARAPGSQEATNQTSPFVDQNQTYTSHPSHQAFLREYVLDGDGNPQSTGRMIDGAGGNIGNWAEVKAQAAAMLGVELVDSDVHNVPLLVTDAYGYLRRTADGSPMAVLAAGGVVALTPGAPIPSSLLARTNHEFLNDIAHSAAPTFTAAGQLNPDADAVAGGSLDTPVPAGSYDNELLDIHFVTGDGRGNENIALTAVHTIFHSEHNRLQANIDSLIQTPGFLTAAEVAAWETTDPASGWDYGERLFQAAKFGTEMQYQHLVFEEFARTLVPSINEFIGDGVNFQSDTNPAIVAEFAHAAYRLGHTMLTETISRSRPDPADPNPANPSLPATLYDIPLLAGFLNPAEFTFNPHNPAVPLTAAQAAGAIFQGGTRQVGNDIDEFVTEAVRNNLVGLPLDLAVLNLARGRSEGLAPLNEVRRQLFAATSDFALEPYANWFEFMLSMKHSASFVNFIAAYGVHPTLTAAGNNLEARRAAAGALLVNSGFLFGPAATTGVNRIDLWVGGITERLAPFGSMLGTTLNYIFEHQLENLQNADRFYYLERLDGLNLLPQLEGNSFNELITRNTEAVGLPAAVFSRPDLIFNVSNLLTGNGETVIGANGVFDDPTTTDINEAEMTDLVRMPDGTFRYFGPAHAIWNGSNSLGDRIYSSEGDDTLTGNGGNDVMEGGAGNDNHVGGLGDDILTDVFGEDVIKGGPGNDAISGGLGPFDLLQGNEGDDFIIGGNDVSETFGGSGNDAIYTGDGATEAFGGAGNDWVEAGPQLDLIVGDENNQFQDDPAQGHDVLIGGKGDDDYDSEGGDDVMIADVLGTERLEGMLGFDYVTYRGDPLPVDADMSIRVVLPPNLDETRDRFDLAEALSGYNQNDILAGEDRVAADLQGLSGSDHVLTPTGIALFNDPVGPGNSLRAWLVSMLGAPAAAPAFRFDGGNILMGGLGSDSIEGGGGDDLIDGDAWINAQLRAPNPAAPGTFQLVDSVHAIKADVFAGLINPGAISIVRRIETPAAGPADVDTAVFTGPADEYRITDNLDGTLTVVHNGGGAIDGTDTLRNIERLQFADGTVALGNSPPTGAPVLSQALPQEGEALSVAQGTIADADGIASALSFQWQQGATAAGPFANIAGATLATFTPAQAQVGQVLLAIVSFTDGKGKPESVPSAPSGVVGDLFVGGAAADIFNGTAGRDNANGAGGNDTLTTGDAADVVTGGAGDDAINTGDGNDSIRFSAAEGGFDAVNGGAGADELRATGAGAVIGLTSVTGVELIIATGADSIIDGSAAANTFNFSAVVLTNIAEIHGEGGNDVITGSTGANVIFGEAGNDTLSGGNGDDELQGQGGADTLLGDAGADILNGGAGNDTLTGGAGNDTMNPGATIGNDVFVFAAGFGADIIPGFGATPSLTVGQDLLNISAIGVTAANFAARVTIAAAANPANTLVTVRNAANAVTGTIQLNAVAAANVTADDFTLAP